MVLQEIRSMNAESLLHNLLGDADDESEKSVNGGAKG